MERAQDRKQAFMASAIRVVARAGLDKATTKAIAADAGLNEALIYRSFQNKEDLLRAAFHAEDMRYIYFLRQCLPVMHTQSLPWKDRAFHLWSACWRFTLERQEGLCFYLQYYYSANCRRYAYQEHLTCFRELFADMGQAFKPGTNVSMLLYQVFDTTLSFAARVLSGELPDIEAATRWAFEQIYSFVVPNVREELLFSGRSAPNCPVEL